MTSGLWLYVTIHSKKCNVCFTYIKHALNVRYKTYIKRMNRVPYVKCMFFTMRYTCVLKNVRLTHGMRNTRFIIPRKALYLHIKIHTLN